MRKERKLFSRLESAGLTRSAAFQILTSPALSRASEEGMVDGVFDASDRIEGGGLVIYLNDLEEEAR